MDKRRICFAWMIVALLAGCVGHRQLSTQSLIGHWESDEHLTEWGRAKFRCVFGADGTLKIGNIFTETFPPTELTNEGTYRIVDHILITDPDLLSKGRPVHVWFEQDDLMVKVDDETPIRLHRIHEE